MDELHTPAITNSIASQFAQLLTPAYVARAPETAERVNQLAAAFSNVILLFIDLSLDGSLKSDEK